MPCPACVEGTCPVGDDQVLGWPLPPEVEISLDEETQDDLADLIEEAVRRGVKAAFKEMSGE